MKAVLSLAVVAALVLPAFAQTFTDCSPLNQTCPADPALGTTFNETYNKDSSINEDVWTIVEGKQPSFGDTLDFTVAGQGEAPTLESKFYMFGGHVEVFLKAAPGQGIVSSIVLLSDDLDEIDWEIIGGNTTHVETNYYGKGNPKQVNAIWYPFDNPQGDYHNYTINWNRDRVEWILDGVLLRTLLPDEAVDEDGKTMFPQTPMQLRIGNWAGGDPSNHEGTIEWAGGETDYTQGPFTMSVQSMKATDGTVNATKYTYGDHSGSWESIEIEKGKSDVAHAIDDSNDSSSSSSLSEKWNGLSNTNRIIIIACSAAGAVLLLLLLGCCCVKKRRSGRGEKAVADAAWLKEQADQNEYRRMGGAQYSMVGSGNPSYASLPNQYGSNQYSANQYGANQYGANQYGSSQYSSTQYQPSQSGQSWGMQTWEAGKAPHSSVSQFR